jgi:uncharacterized protein YecE (DUF72 family)
MGGFFPTRTPANEFLRLYSRRLTAVEGNTTFYATPSAETIARWVQETPSTFQFCPKVARSISHTTQLDDTREEPQAFVERLRGLGTRLGPLFLQLPPSFAPAHLERLQAFLDFWPSDVRLAVEVRHTAFYEEVQAAKLNTLFERHRIARVIMDTRPLRVGSTQEQQVLEARKRKPNLPVQVALTADFSLVRYIGHPDLEVNVVFLDSWAQQLSHWLKQGVTLYVFCHCPLDERAPLLCAELYQRVKSLTSLPPLPWQPPVAVNQPEIF